MTSAEEFGLAMPYAAVVDVAGLVREYSGVMFRVAHAVLRSPQEAEDVVQDAFVRVLERRASWAR